MKTYWGIVDRHGKALMSEAPERETRATMAILAKDYPNCAPFRVAQFVEMDEVASTLAVMADISPNGITPRAALLSAATAFSDDAFEALLRRVEARKAEAS